MNKSFYYPMTNSELSELCSMADVDRAMQNPENVQDFEAYNPDFDDDEISIYALANKDGSLVLAEFFRNGDRQVLWVYGDI